MRDRVENPLLLAGAAVDAADVSARREPRPFACSGAEYKQVLEYDTWSSDVVSQSADVAIETLSEIHLSVVAEAHRRLPCLGVKRDKLRTVGEENSLVLAAGPVRHAAIDAAGPLVIASRERVVGP